VCVVVKSSLPIRTNVRYMGLIRTYLGHTWMCFTVKLTMTSLPNVAVNDRNKIYGTYGDISGTHLDVFDGKVDIYVTPKCCCDLDGRADAKVWRVGHLYRERERERERENHTHTNIHTYQP
jgi:hypothetical protein